VRFGKEANGAADLATHQLASHQTETEDFFYETIR